jgi:hypothetical protein
MSFAPNETQNVADIAIAELLTMLRYKRPFGSECEKAFVERFIGPLGPQVLASNQVVRIPRADGEHSRTLFSCHTDTVHRESGMQEVCYDSDIGVIYKDDGKPLGADDGAGVFLLLHMIRHAIPGTYVFHTGEECGGVGSRLMSETEEDFLKQFDRAIAFDRKGSTSVITRQAFDECCSPAFGTALADALNGADLTFNYDSDPSGVFTDTANYTHIIPECTNVSCGYEAEHTGNEMLDVQHLFQLADALLLVDWDKLPTERDPKDALYFGFADWKPRSFSRKSKNRRFNPTGWRHTPGYVPGRVALASPLDPIEDYVIDEEEQDMHDELELANAASSEFFSMCVDHRYDRAYNSLRTDEVEDFYLADRESFAWLLDRMDECNIEDEEIIDFVRSY